MVSGFYEPYVRAILQREIKTTDIIVDVGANIGVYVIPLARIVTKVIAFEPHPKVSEILEKNIKLNKLENVVLNKKAVSDSQKSVILDVSSGSPLLSKILISDSDSFRTDPAHVEVQSIDLDSALALENKVDWLLIDVEGHEVNVLNSARNTLQKFSPKIIIEIQPENFQNVNSLLTNECYSISKIYSTYYYATKVNAA